NDGIRSAGGIFLFAEVAAAQQRDTVQRKKIRGHERGPGLLRLKTFARDNEVGERCGRDTQKRMLVVSDEFVARPRQPGHVDSKRGIAPEQSYDPVTRSTPER